MRIFEIEGIPVPWASHKGCGRRSFNPRFKEKQFFQWQIKAQYYGEKPIEGAVWAAYYFYLPIPKATSKIKRKQMLAGILRPSTRPDRDNYAKFLSDCLTGIVIEDDSLIVDGPISKWYGEVPKTVIKICPIAEYTLGHFPLHENIS